MPLTAKEKQARYRERLKTENPEKYEEQRKKNLARIKSKKKKNSEMEPIEAEAKRKEWREEKRISRHRRKNKNQPLSNTCSDGNSDGSIESYKIGDCKFKKLNFKLKLASRKHKHYEDQIKKLRTKIECFKKRMQRLQSQASKSIANLERKIDNVVARNELLEITLKTTFSDCLKHTEKRLIKKVIYNSKNKQYTSKVLGLKVTARQKTKRMTRFEICNEITDFYVRDDVSRITSGKKECRVKNKQKEQIRYLVDSISNLYKKYKAEGGRYGLTTFYKRKPFFVLSPYIQSRSTCLCVKHDNIKFKYETLRRHQLLKQEFDQLYQELVCDTKNYACMYNICNGCKNKSPTFVTEQHMLEKTVNWYQWERQDHLYSKKGGTTVHTKKTVRAVKTDTAQTLIKDFSRDLIAFKKHHFNNIHQQYQYQRAIKNMKPTEAVVVCDFSENYVCKLTREIQSMHFGASKSQISLHTGMIYFLNESQSFCTMSDNLTHQPPAIWAHLTPILKTITDKYPNIEVIHFYSDGPSSQYRQKHNFFLHSLFTRDLNLSYSTWSYFESGHGKSVADGIGGTIKRMLDSKVCHGTDIKTARDAYEAIKKSNTVIQVHLIQEDSINYILNKIPDGVLVLPGTMKLHQIIACDGVTIKYRDLSCFCEPLRGNCSCFSPNKHTLLSTNRNYISGSEIDLVNSPLYQTLPEEQQELFPLEDTRTALYETLDMEGIKDFVGDSPSILDTDFDIDLMPLIILPEKKSSNNESSNNTDIYLTPQPCSSKTKETTKKTSKDEISLGPKSKKLTKSDVQLTLNKIQHCHKCICSMLGRHAKCMACKQLLCENCAGSLYMDYLCDTCLLGSDDGQIV